ncbi:MAG: hypothetical protein IKL55_02355 [Clostridia bacterium]|nr:hypothetical protein [Clostridia bacterium]
MNPKDKNLKNKKNVVDDDFDEDIVVKRNTKVIKDSDDELNSMNSDNESIIIPPKEEIVEDEDEEYEIVEDEDEEYEVVEDEDEEYEVVEDEDEEYEVVEDEDEEYEVVEDEDEEYEVVEDEDEKVEAVEVENDEAIDDIVLEVNENEVKEVEDNHEEESEKEIIITNDDENGEDEVDKVLNGKVEIEEESKMDENTVESSTNGDLTGIFKELGEEAGVEFEEDDDYEFEDEDEDEEELEPIEEDEEEEESIYPAELVNIELECIFLGLMFNNPKAISRFYFKYEDCRFSDDELMNLYKIIIFRDGEAYAPAIAKDKYQLPRETPNTYDLRLKVRRIAAAGDYNLEHIYTELKKLFILKKNYLVAPTSIVQQKILEIQNYELYKDMTVEEVESALEQITVTTGLTQGRLNEDTTAFLLAGDNALSNGISIPFNILSTVFKGLRQGETMCYAMPSNSGKSRFTINLASYISFVHKQKVLIISNEMSEEKMKLCMITTILNNPEIQAFHGQKISKTEGELLELLFRPDKGKRVKCDENGYILRKENESQEDFIERLRKNSSEFRQTIAVTDWVNTQLNNSIFFIHITEHTNDDLRKIIMNYYYKEGIQYMFYDTLKADTANIGNSDEVKKTATILSNLAQKFRIFIASSMQLLESSTLPVNLTINDMSASKTVKEVLDTLCLIKQISRRTLHKYEYSDTDLFEKCHEIDVPKDTDVRFYACVVDKNRAGAKPTVLFRLNLAYNRWEELGHLRLKQTEIEED